MAQSPFLVDQIQIEPGSNQVLVISRDSATGALKFKDAVTTGGLLLYQLAGLRTVANVRIVGKSGAGAQYTTIQSALNTIPSNASATNPYIILVMPGRYDETLNIVRDGVRLIGLGEPEIRSALETSPDAPGADHTLIVSAQLGTIPRSLVVEGFIISNVHANKAAVRVVGAAASTVGDGGIVLKGCSLRANSAVGNYSLWATACGDIRVEGGSWQEASDLGLLRVEEVSNLTFSGVEGLGACDLRYDTTEAIPSGGAGTYRFDNCPRIATSTSMPTPFAADLSGGGALEFNNCTTAALQVSGNQTVVARNSVLGNLTLQDTIAMSLWNTTRGTTNVNATAALTEGVKGGTAVFDGDTFIAVAFDIPCTGTYQVSFELDSRPTNDETPWITAKATTGFRINFQTAQTLSVLWRATRTDM